jgi:hypothetical protein
MLKVLLCLGILIACGAAVIYSDIQLTQQQYLVLAACAVGIAVVYGLTGLHWGGEMGYEQGWRDALTTQPIFYDDPDDGLTIGVKYETLAAVEHTDPEEGHHCHLNIVCEMNDPEHLVRCVRSGLKPLPKSFFFTPGYGAKETPERTQT